MNLLRGHTRWRRVLLRPVEERAARWWVPAKTRWWRKGVAVMKAQVERRVMMHGRRRWKAGRRRTIRSAVVVRPCGRELAWRVHWRGATEPRRRCSHAELGAASELSWAQGWCIAFRCAVITLMLLLVSTRCPVPLSLTGLIHKAAALRFSVPVSRLLVTGRRFLAGD